MHMFSLLTFLFSLTNAVEPTYGNITGVKAEGLYNDANFLNMKRIQKGNILNAESSGDYNNHPISYAIDNNFETFWVGGKVTTDTEKNVVIFTFNQIQSIECILYYLAHQTLTDGRHYYGLPRILNVYSSVSNQAFELKYRINSNPELSDRWNCIAMELPKPVACDKLKLEFVEVTQDNISHEFRPMLAEIVFIKNVSYYHLSVQQAVDKYADSNYINSHIILQTECTIHCTGGDQDGHPTSDLYKTGLKFWAADTPTTATFKNSLIYEFKQTQYIDSIVYGPSYSTNRNARPNTRRYDGFPLVLFIYTAIGDDDYELQLVETGVPVNTIIWDTIQIIFPQTLWCDKIKLEFEAVTLDQSFGNRYTPSAQFIHILKSDRQIDPNMNRPRLSQPTTSDKQPIKLNITETNFSNLGGVEFGGAAYIVNCETTFKNTIFSHCSSTIAGGGIFLNTQYDKEHINTFEEITFLNCQSGYGGAICVLAPFQVDYTSIISCSFNANTATDDNMGGSAIYIAAVNGKVKSCRFSGNIGRTLIKYASASALRSIKSARLEIVDCHFDEEIEEGRFYVEVDEVLSKRISLKGNQIGRNQHKEMIHINQRPIAHQNEKTTKTRYQIGIMILVSCLVVVSLIIIISVYFHHRNEQEIIDEKAESTNEEEI